MEKGGFSQKGPVVLKGAEDLSFKVGRKTRLEEELKKLKNENE